MAIGRPTSYREEYCQMLVDHMSQGFSYESFAGLVSVSKQTIYDWEKAQPAFLDAKRLAMEKNRLFWEKVGLEGMYMGGKDNPFNATVWVFNMKNRFQWSDRNEVKQEITEHKINLSYKDEDND